MDLQARSRWIKEAALQEGFAFAGIARAEHMDAEARHLEAWLQGGLHATMSFMERHFDLRTDPTVLVPGAKSVITLMDNYHTEKRQEQPLAPKVSRYAYGEDYHRVIRKKLKAFLQTIRGQFGEVAGRGFVDSGPVLERDWARRSGIGWTGKNTLLIHPKAGSYFFLAELITDLELTPDTPISDHCGTCTRCIEACPTGAIAENGYLLDSGKCISYLTIELRDEHIPDRYSGKMENWVFGCDICQEVCPWNRFSTPHREPAFEPDERFLAMTPGDWEQLTEPDFEELFSHTPVKRTGYAGLRRNLDFLKTSHANRQDGRQTPINHKP
jgi:epoxyqueuosine reductase